MGGKRKVCTDKSWCNFVRETLLAGEEQTEIAVKHERLCQELFAVYLKKSHANHAVFLLFFPFYFLFTKSICIDVAGTCEKIFAVFNQACSHQFFIRLCARKNPDCTAASSDFPVHSFQCVGAGILLNIIVIMGLNWKCISRIKFE